MADINASFTLDLDKAIKQVQEFRKNLLGARQALEQSAGADPYKNYASSTQAFNAELKKAVQSAGQAAQAQQAYAAAITRQAESMKSANTAHKDAIQNYKSINTQLTEAKRKQADLSKEIENTTKSSGGLSGIIGKVGAAFAGLAVVGFLKDVAGKVFDVTASFQKYQAVLGNTLGSAEAASRAMAMIKDVAAS
jgi:t-SNARE complex subunit (syntaxin)